MMALLKVVMPVVVATLIITLFTPSLIDLDAVVTDLETNLLYQKDVIRTINSTLRKFLESESNYLHTLGLIGPSGVGKSMAVNIIKNHISGSILEHYGNIPNINKYNSNNVIILENLTIVDIHFLIEFFKALPNDKILLIYICSIQETDLNLKHSIHYEHVDLIARQFKEAVTQKTMQHDFALFRELDEKQVRHWVEEQLSSRHVEVEALGLNTLIDRYDVRFRGLKGLHAKIINLIV